MKKTSSFEIVSFKDLYLKLELLPLFLGTRELRRDAQPLSATEPNQNGSVAGGLGKVQGSRYSPPPSVGLPPSLPSGARRT